MIILCILSQCWKTNTCNIALIYEKTAEIWVCKHLIDCLSNAVVEHLVKCNSTIRIFMNYKVYFSVSSGHILNMFGVTLGTSKCPSVSERPNGVPPSLPSYIETTVPLSNVSTLQGWLLFCISASSKELSTLLCMSIVIHSHYFAARHYNILFIGWFLRMF